MTIPIRTLRLLGVAAALVVVLTTAPVLASGLRVSEPMSDGSQAAQPAVSDSQSLNEPYYSDVIGSISIRQTSVSTTYVSDIRGAVIRKVLVGTVRRTNITVVKLADAVSPRLAGWVGAGTALYQVRVTYFVPGTRTVSGYIVIGNSVAQSIRTGGVGAATTPALEEVVFQ
jgi:hypothetical protein